MVRSWHNSQPLHRSNALYDSLQRCPAKDCCSSVTPNNWSEVAFDVRKPTRSNEWYVVLFDAPGKHQNHEGYMIRLNIVWSFLSLPQLHPCLELFIRWQPLLWALRFQKDLPSMPIVRQEGSSMLLLCGVRFKRGYRCVAGWFFQVPAQPWRQIQLWIAPSSKTEKPPLFASQ